MPRIDVKAERVGDGCVISAHVKDWELMQSFPHAIVRDVVDSLVTRFIQENGDMILGIVNDPELLSEAVGREVAHRVRKYISDKKKVAEERRAR